MNQARYKPIYLYSCGTSFNISKELHNRLQLADYIYGSKNLLNALPQCTAQKINITAKAKEQAQEILNFARNGKKIIVLCSGDCLYHGFGSTLLSLSDPKEQQEFFEITPNTTAFQALCAKCNISWQDAELFTAHFQQDIPLRKIAQTPKAIIYGGSQYTASTIAKQLCLFSSIQKKRSAILAECLGTEHEQIIHATLEEISILQSHPTSILLLLPFKQFQEADNITDTRNMNTNTYEQHTYTQNDYTLTLGLDNTFYTKENNLITQADCRAIILSRLRLLPDGIFWDLGAGSGAVGLEVAGLCNMQVYGIEKNSIRCEYIIQNKKKLGITNYTLITGDILETIKTLPPADRIFIGGGGAELETILTTCKKYSKKHALIAVSAVTLESYQKLYTYQNMERICCLHITIAEEQEIAKKYHHFKPYNPLYLFIFENKDRT